MLRLLSATPKLESDLTLTLAGTGDTGDTGAGMLEIWRRVSGHGGVTV
jgi:hypothetical protein